MQQYADIYSLSRHSTCFGCHAPIIRSTKNCICNCVSHTSPDQDTVEGNNGTITMTYTRGSRYSF